MQQKPVAIGLVLCEQVIIEEKTRNVSAINCFTHRQVERFPSENLSFVVYAVLTNGVGEITLEVAIQRLDTLDEVYRRSGSLKFVNPLQEARCVFRIRDCSFPVAGHYQVILLADNDSIAQRRFRITQ